MSTEIRTRINELEEKASTSKTNGYYLEALDQYEQLLILKKQLFPDNSQEISKVCDQIVILCNILAMIYLQKQSYQLSLELLKKAEILSEKNIKLRAVTYNNLGCFYGRKKKIRSSATFTEEALMLEYQYLNSVETNSEFEKTLLIDNPSDAHLNICVALSHLGKHQDALQHAMKALVFIQNELCERQLLSSPATHTKDSDKNNEILNNEILKPIEDRYVVLAIAYHNLAVQYEFLNMFDPALDAYAKAVQFATKFLGETHMMTKNLRQVRDQASEKIQKQLERQLARKQNKWKNQHTLSLREVVHQSNENKHILPPEGKDPYSSQKQYKAKAKLQSSKNRLGNTPYHQEATSGSKPKKGRTGKTREDSTHKLMNPRVKQSIYIYISHIGQ